MLDATERKTLLVTTFVSACLCFAPGEVVSGIALLIVSGLLYRYNSAMTRKEEAAQGSAEPPAPPEPAPPGPVATP